MLGETVNFNGKHIHVRGAKLLFPPIQQPYPPLYFGGSSDVAQELAAEQVDFYLTWGEPPELVKEKIEQVRAKAAAHGRKIRFGIRLHVIVRETSDEAWQAAERLISHLDDETIAKAQAAFARTDSVGQQRMAALHNGKRDNLEISPNLWAGVGLVRGGAGTALVGDGPTVAARINEYAALGIDSFVLSGYPHLEEAYRVGELLFPHLDVAIPEIPQPQPLNPQGEAVANEFIPVKSRKAKEQNDGNASEKVVIARCPLVFTGGHRGGVATGLLSWLAVDAYFALTGRGSDGVLDALRQRRIVAASGDQLLAGAHWLFNWRIAGLDSGTD